MVKTNTKSTKLRKQATDDGMVVFPMANGKLATTWVSNVDAILSEGTGKLDIERLKELKDKLTNTMSLLTGRISELEIEQADKAAKAFIDSKIAYVTTSCVGKTVKFVFNMAKSFFGVITSAEVTHGTLCIRGIYPNYMQRNNGTYNAYSHSGVAQFVYNTPLKNTHFRELGDPSHFILSSDNTSTCLEFGISPEYSCTSIIKDFLSEIYAQLHLIDKLSKKKNPSQRRKISNK